jgi:kynurenine formamidase
MRHFALPLLLLLWAPAALAQNQPPLWQLYNDHLKAAKYVDLTHTIEPDSPVWKGFGPQTFQRSVVPATGRPYEYETDGFEAGSYIFSTDQLGTQLDPPAHWDPYFPAIDELPATYTLRPLVVIPMHEQVARDPGYQLKAEDVRAWEARNGPIPEGSVVFLRSDWSKRWGEPGLVEQEAFPGITLDALKYLHLERKILLHGHEPLDTDTTPTLEGEDWLLHNGYTQAEGLSNLDQVPERGALVAIGFAKIAGGLGGYARYIAICPPDWKFGVSVGEVPEAPLPRLEKPLRWDPTRGRRVRDEGGPSEPGLPHRLLLLPGDGETSP